MDDQNRRNKDENEQTGLTQEQRRRGQKGGQVGRPNENDSNEETEGNS